MCGIAGIVNAAEPVSKDRVIKMTNAIAHRGPDGEGHWFNSSGRVGLGHRRLSIIDLSRDGAQPMHFGEGRYSIVFNGEIYNYLELRQDLVGKGIHFRSHSDTEVLLALYSIKKEKCLDELDGMFSFAIWDEQEQTLFCARDRFGEKPFYYSHISGNTFVFGSEIKQLFSYGIRKEVNERMAYNFMINRYVLSNPSDNSETFYNKINKLEPAHYLIVDSDLRIHKKRYWDLDIHKEDLDITFEDASARFKELFERSIRRRLRSDVPVGSSLSGGLDSSTIVCLIDRINQDKKICQKTFSARFKNFAKDEGRYMEEVVVKTNAEAHFTWPDEEGFINEIDKVIFHQDEPFASASIFAQWSVMKLAKEQNVTVLIDGQGADEILAGYHYYFSTYLKQLFQNGSSRYTEELIAYRQMHNPTFKDFSSQVDTSLFTQSSLLSKLMAWTKNMVRPAYRLIRPVPVKTYHSKENQFQSDYANSFSSGDVFQHIPSENLKEVLYWNTCIYGLEDLLRYADRNSMAFSREVRLPFLEHELVEFVFSLPSEFKISKGWTKYILRKSFENIMPPDISWRTDKIGYEPPQSKWMANPKINEMIQEAKLKLEQRRILNPRRDIKEDDDWTLLMAGKMLF
jgi:asparagine synthase (glutamine-hydrolysing)